MCFYFTFLIIWQSIITLFQLGYNYFTRLIPYIIIAPLYLQGDLDFGAIAQASVAFAQVLSALSLVTNQIQNKLNRKKPIRIRIHNRIKQTSHKYHKTNQKIDNGGARV